MGPMGELGALFNPGMRHELEERRSKAMRREEEGNARDGDDLRIDLESGVAVIGGAASDSDGAAVDAGSDEADVDGADVREADGSGDAASVSGPARAAAGSLERRTAAARRAAARSKAAEADTSSDADGDAPAERVSAKAVTKPPAAPGSGRGPVRRPMTKSGRASR